MLFRRFGEVLWSLPLHNRKSGRLGHRLTACQFGSTFLAESPQMLAQQGGIGQLERVAGSTRQEGSGRPRDLRTGRLYAAASSCRYGHGVHHQRPNQVATQLRSSTSASRSSTPAHLPRLRQREQPTAQSRRTHGCTDQPCNVMNSLLPTRSRPHRAVRRTKAMPMTLSSRARSGNMGRGHRTRTSHDYIARCASPCSSQKRMSISRYSLMAVVSCSCAASVLLVR